MLHHIPEGDDAWLRRYADAGNQYLPEASSAELPCQPSCNLSKTLPAPLPPFLLTPQSATPCTEIQHPTSAGVTAPAILRIPTLFAFMSSSEVYGSRLNYPELTHSVGSTQKGHARQPYEQLGWPKVQNVVLKNGTKGGECRPQFPPTSSETRGSWHTSTKTDGVHLEARVPRGRTQAQLSTTTGVECQAAEAERKQHRHRCRSGSRKNPSHSGKGSCDDKPGCFEICSALLHLYNFVVSDLRLQRLCFVVLLPISCVF